MSRARTVAPPVEFRIHRVRGADRRGRHGKVRNTTETIEFVEIIDRNTEQRVAG